MKFKDTITCKVAQGVILAYLLMAVATLLIWGIALGIKKIADDASPKVQTVSYSVTAAGQYGGSTATYDGKDDYTRDANGLY